MSRFYNSPVKKQIFVALLVVLLSVVKAKAQDYIYAVGNPAFSTDIPIENGSINIANGNLHMEIPLSSLPQRGTLSSEVRLVYDSRIWKIVQSGSTFSWQPTNVPNSQGGWRVLSPATGTVTFGNFTSSCGANPVGHLTYNNWVWTDPQGTTRRFNLTTVQPVNGGCFAGDQGTPNADGLALDGSGFHAFITNYFNAAIFAKDGTRLYPTLTDPNGNFFSPGANGGLITDTLQRSPVNVTQNGNQTYYDVLTFQGQRARYTVTTGTIALATHFNQEAVAEFSGNITVIQSIQLPDGSSYMFNYDSGAYGELTGITLPTSGQIAYGYVNFLDSYQNQNRWINSRTTEGRTWQFTPTVITQCAANGTGCTEKVTVTRPAVNSSGLADDTVYTFTLNNGAWNSRIDYFTSSAGPGWPTPVLLATVTTDYDFTNPCPAMTCNGSQFIQAVRRTFTLPNGKSSKVEYSYDTPANGNVTSIKEWDFFPANSPPATPYRETRLTYVTDPSYVSKGIIDKIASIVINDSSGTAQSQTQFQYDEFPLAHIDGVPQHDDVNFPYTSLIRGNATTVKHWLKGLSGAADRWISNTLTYDQLGNTVTETDSLGNLKTIIFSSANSYAYPVQVQLPDTSSTNPPTMTHHRTSTAYDLSTGSVTSFTDENSQVTTYGYDSLGRLSSIVYPTGGGQDTFTYPDTQNATKTEQLDLAGTTRKSYSHLDAFGHLDRVAMTNDEGTYDQRDQCYDARGQLQFGSYPYQASGFASPKVCSGAGDSFTYDGLGRLSSVTHSDSSFISAGYTGSTVNYYDERATLVQLEQSDAFGRITAVCEISSTTYIGSDTPGPCGMDLSATGLLTTYQYNTIDRLLQINQGNRTARVKAYDSLGRMITDAIPELGGQSAAMAFGYNDNDDIVFRKRPKPNQTNPALLLTTSYSYDSLGRLVNTSYDDGVTPALSYFYDDTTVSGRTGSMGIGRLTSEQVGGPAANGAAFYYDAMGNVLYDDQATPRVYGTSRYSMAYQYNLDSSATSFTNGATGVTFSYTFNSGGTRGGRTTGMTSSLSDASHPATLLSGVHYGPFGRTQATYGSGAIETAGYSPRGIKSSKQVTKGTVVGVTAAHASITLGGQPYSDFSGNCDVGYVTMTAGSGSTAPITYSCFFTAAQMAQALVNNFSAPNVTATASNGVITLTASTLGSVGNGISFSFSYSSTFGGIYPPPYTFTPASGSLSGGTDSFPVVTLYSFSNSIRSDGVYISSNDSVMGSLNFGYDDLKRLTSSPGYTWDLDRFGNRWHQNGSFSQQESFDVNNHGSNVTYDILGNITNDGLHSFTYDAENRITAVDGGSTATYAYDANGRRIRKVTSAGTSEFVYDLADNIAAEIGPSSSWTRAEIYYDDGSHIGTYTNTPGNVATYFSLTDWVDTERVRTNSSGAVVQTCSSLLYGDAQSCSGSDVSPVHFTGYEHDSESGLDYANNRYYNPRLGRFMSADLLEGSVDVPQSFNRYSYVQGDPVNGRDPSGMFLESTGGGAVICGPACAAIGAILDIIGLFHLFGHHHPVPHFRGTTNPRTEVFSHAAYIDCAKKAFGATKGTIPGSDKQIPSENAAKVVMEASTATGADPASVGVTMAGESNSTLNPDPYLNTTKAGAVKSYDVGPMQLNTKSSGALFKKFPGSRGKTIAKDTPFDGSPLANTKAGATRLKGLKNPADYVGRLGKKSSAQAKAIHKSREDLYKQIYNAMKTFTDCLSAAIK